MSEATATTPQVKAIPADTFRARLVLARIHAGDLTIKEAADRCGLNYGSWSNWERGGKPRDLLDTIERISDGLGIDRDWLLFGGPLTTERRPALRTVEGVTYARRDVNRRKPQVNRTGLHHTRTAPDNRGRTGRPATRTDDHPRPENVTPRPRTGQPVRRPRRISTTLPDAA